LPLDFPGGANTYGSVQRVYVSLNARETQALLQTVPAPLGTPINTVLLTALALVYARWTGERRLLVEVDAHGREDLFPDVEVSRTIGWFTSLYPVLLDVRTARDDAEALAVVQAQLAHTPRRGFGYNVLRYLSADSRLATELNRLAPPLNFNYLGQFDQPLAADGAALPFRVADEAPGPEQSPEGRRWAQLYVVGVVAGRTLDLQWSFSPQQFRQATIDRLAKDYLDQLRRLIRFAQNSAPLRS
jgi:non-ribosomal peptide synthase protein (TIGR01720 family)